MMHKLRPLRVCEGLPKTRECIYEIKKGERRFFSSCSEVYRSVPRLIVHRKWEHPMSLDINHRLMESTIWKAIAEDVKQLLYDTELMFLINRLEGPPEEYKILRGLGLKEELVRIALENRRAYAVYNNPKTLTRTISVSNPRALSLTDEMPSRRLRKLLT